MTPPRDRDVTAEPDAQERSRVAPRFSDWVWRPWYAKIWWLVTIGYWFGAFIAGWVPALRPVFQNDRFPIIFLILHPFFIFPVLGYGYARACLLRPESGDSALEDDDDIIECAARIERDRLSHTSWLDPFNPVSPINPANQLNPINSYQHKPF